MIEFLGLEWDERCLLFHKSPRDVMTLSYDQVRRPMYAESIGRWRRFESHIGVLRDALEEEN